MYATHVTAVFGFYGVFAMCIDALVFVIDKTCAHTHTHAHTYYSNILRAVLHENNHTLSENAKIRNLEKNARSPDCKNLALVVLQLLFCE